MRASWIRHSLACLVPLSTACNGPTAPSPPSLDELLAHRAIWDAQAPAHYSYVYGVRNVWMTLLDGQALLLEVRQDTVRSATVVGTGQPVPGSLTFYPSINGLFDLAVTSLGEQRLAAVSFDPQRGYPLRMDLCCVPDASGSIYASNVTRLP